MAGRQIALLRGVNVGRAKRVAMGDLRALVHGLGYRDVQTLLNSGNIVFTVPSGIRGEHAARIEIAIAQRLSVSTRVTVLTAAELGAAIADNPLLDAARDPSRLLVAVLRQTADRSRLAPLAKRDWAPDEFAIGRRVAYLWCPNGTIQSPLAESVNRALGDAVTTRNWATMVKLKALAETPP